VINCTVFDGDDHTDANASGDVRTARTVYVCGTVALGATCVYGNDTFDAINVDPSRTSYPVAYGGTPDAETTTSDPDRLALTPVGALGVVHTVAHDDQAD